MPRWHILVEGRCREIDTSYEGFRAALQPHHGRVAHDGRHMTMTIIIEAQEAQDAAKQALDLWWAHLPSTRFLTILIWEVEDASLAAAGGGRW
jgi:hypothetical protein